MAATPEATFNSLFEMPFTVRYETPWGAVDAFNSLFEMLITTGEIRARTAYFAFNSLFEMPDIKSA